MHIKTVRRKGRTYYYEAKTEWDKTKKKPIEKTIRRLSEEEAQPYLAKTIAKTVLLKETLAVAAPKAIPRIDRETFQVLLQTYQDTPFEVKATKESFPKAPIVEILKRYGYPHKIIQDVTSSTTKYAFKMLYCALKTLEEG